MKKHDSHPIQNGHQIPLSEKLRRIRDALREAESILESEMAMREFGRIIQAVEHLEGESGA